MSSVILTNFNDLVAKSLADQGISEGPKGDSGKSAYDIAVDNDYSGTESEWLDSLNGADGTTPVKDTDYFDGTDGTDGVDGKDGIDGVDGADGVDGVDGTSVTIDSVVNNDDDTLTINFSDGTSHTTDSIKGNVGDQGAQGIQGEKGDVGDALTVTDVVNNDDNTITISFSDGTTHTTDSVKGEIGDTGVGISGISLEIAGDPGGYRTFKVTYDDGTSQNMSFINPELPLDKLTDLVDMPDDYDDSCGKVLKVKCDGTGVEFADMVLTLDDPVPEDIGGIVAGTEYNNTPIEDVLRQLLNPYQVPYFSSFTLDVDTLLEVGDALGDVTFSYDIANVNEVDGQVDFDKEGSVEDTVDNDVHNIDFNGASLVKDTPDTVTFNVTATDTNGDDFTLSLVVEWGANVYYGEGQDTIDEDGIKNLRVANLGTESAGSYKMAEDDYKWICYPTSFGELTEFKDASTGYDVAMDSPVKIDVTNSYDKTLEYTCHRSYNAMASEITINAS